MISDWELEYKSLIKKILKEGDMRPTRNANTKAIFGQHLTVDMSANQFPLLTCRKMFPKGVLGELAAMLRQPKHIRDFERWGCNYWKLWAKADGSINVDYGNAWFDFNGVNQIEALKSSLRNNPTDRRMLISGWRPDNVDNLDLPCCHHTYQFFVADGKLSMLWMQRSVDIMIGLPSDIVFAAAWLLAICNEFGFRPGEITFSLGDCHIYESHIPGAEEYVQRVRNNWALVEQPTVDWVGVLGKDFCEFEPDDLFIGYYDPLDAIKLELHE